jgi:hypothetical protein
MADRGGSSAVNDASWAVREQQLGRSWAKSPAEFGLPGYRWKGMGKGYDRAPQWRPGPQAAQGERS